MTNLNSVRLQLYFNNCTIKNYEQFFFAITGFHLKESDEVARGHYWSHASSRLELSLSITFQKCFEIGKGP